MKFSLICLLSCLRCWSQQVTALDIVDLSLPLEESLYSPGADYFAEVMKNETSVLRAIILEKGKVVFKYFEDEDEAVTGGEPLHVFSLTKTWMSCLFGIMMKNGLLDSLNETLGDIWPTEDEVWSGIEDAEARQNITLQQMLTMTSGLVNTDELGLVQALFVGTAGGEDLKETLAWHTFNQSQVGQFNYLPTSNIMSYVIQKKTGMTPREYAGQTIFPALGIEDDGKTGWFDFSEPIKWMQNKDDLESGFHGLKLKIHQMAKIGQLYFQRGMASPENKILTEDFVNESLSPLENDSTGDATDNLDPNVILNGGFVNWKIYGDYFCTGGAFGNLVCFDPKTERVIAKQESSWRVSLANVVEGEFDTFKDIAFDENLSFEPYVRADICNTICAEAAPCYDTADGGGCAAFDQNAFKWAESYEKCNEGAIECLQCYPECSLGISTESFCEKACLGTNACFDDAGCAALDKETFLWSGSYSGCNIGGIACSACYPGCIEEIDLCSTEECSGDVRSCFDEEGCAILDMSTYSWTGEYAACTTEGALACAACYPECYFSKNISDEEANEEFCTACQVAAPCFDEMGCAALNKETSEWLESHSQCNGGAIDCASCFPECFAEETGDESDDTKEDFCGFCAEAAPCFDEMGCAALDLETFEWSGVYQNCTQAAPCAGCYTGCTDSVDDFCAACQEAAPCYDATGCLYLDKSNLMWLEPYDGCNLGAQACAACFSDCILSSAEAQCAGECQEAFICFSEEGCAAFDQETSLWSEAYAECNIRGAIDCAECYPSCNIEEQNEASSSPVTSSPVSSAPISVTTEPTVMAKEPPADPTNPPATEVSTPTNAPIEPTVDVPVELATDAPVEETSTSAAYHYISFKKWSSLCIMTIITYLIIEVAMN